MERIQRRESDRRRVKCCRSDESSGPLADLLQRDGGKADAVRSRTASGGRLWLAFCQRRCDSRSDSVSFCDLVGNIPRQSLQRQPSCTGRLCFRNEDMSKRIAVPGTENIMTAVLLAFFLPIGLGLIDRFWLRKRYRYWGATNEEIQRP